MKTVSRFDFALILQRLVLVIFALFPITLAAIAQVLFIFRTWDALKAVQISLLVGVFIVPVVLIFISPALWAMLEKHKNLLVLWVLAIAIGLREWNAIHVLGPLVGGLVGVNLYAMLFENKK